MTTQFTQANRHARIYTPLGEDVLLFKSLRGTERLGAPFQYDLVLLSEQPEIEYQEIIGRNVTLTVDKQGSQPRYFNGYISRFEQVQFEGELREYRATLVPWLWFLTRSSDCRIFQDLTTPEIIQQVFKDHGFDDVSSRLHETYPKWEFCVQYRETAFNFVSRLMEQEGIYYYFKHQDGRHTIVLCESIGSHLQFVGYEDLEYSTEPRGPGHHEYERLWSWTVHREIQTGSYQVNGFDFEQPRKDLLRNYSVAQQQPGSGPERYDYPGEFRDSAQAERYARTRLEEQQARHEVFSGQGDVRGTCTGVRFTLKGHPGRTFEREYLTTGVDYKIETSDYITGGAEAEPLQFEATLWAIPSDQPFRSPSTARKPEIAGPQTAIVVGPPGEEIYTDKYGRVKLKFHWDRYNKADEKASCWVRVAQVWAGKNWGAIYLPRVGQEVIVEFLEGNPDQPIITGSVYNGSALPPYNLPANKTISTLKSNSTKGGQGFNEIRFDDKKGEEQIFIHAEKNQDIRIKNDTKTWVGNEQHLIIKKDRFELTEGNQHSTVKGDRLDKIEGDHGETIKGHHLMTLEGCDELTIKGDQRIKIEGNANLKTGGNINEEAAAKVSTKAADIHLKAGSSYAVDGGTIYIKGGTTVVIEAGVQLSLKASGSFVDIGPAGVAISGTMVLINSGGAAGSGDGCSPTAPATPQTPAEPGSALEADKAETGSAMTIESSSIERQKPEWQWTKASPAAAVLKQAAKDGTPFCEECERAKKTQETS